MRNSGKNPRDRFDSQRSLTESDGENRKVKLVIASSNLHKVREIRSILKEKGDFDLVSLRDFPEYTLPEEVGSTFEQNAIDKAIAAAEALGAYVIADDSGLVVPALGGRPGVYSARYAGAGATDKENRIKLLVEMKELEGEARSAFFECCMALASPEGLEKVVSARCEGHIAEKERGGQGFGYDPIFIKRDYNKTFSELEDEVKNRISHRRKALDKLSPLLETRVLSH